MDIDLTQKLQQKMNARPRTQGRYNASEMYFITSGRLTPEHWLHAPPRPPKELLLMWNGIGIHNQIQDLLGIKNAEEKREFVYKDIVLVGKVDYLPPNMPEELWELKTSDSIMMKAKPWHRYQTKLYCTMFDKKQGIVYQPVQNGEGIYLKNLGTVQRDDEWFEKELAKLYAFHLRVEELWKSGSAVLLSHKA